MAGTVLALCLLAPAPALASDSLFWNWSSIQYNPAADRPQVVDSGISVAAADGSGGRQFTEGGGTMVHPLGLAIDSATGKIYWASFGTGIDYCYGSLYGPNSISYAKLDGTGGGDLNTSGATVDGPDGVSIDPATRRIYWANEFGDKISYANLDGSGGGDLNTGNANVDCPAGLVVDHALGRVYWTDLDGNQISWASLDGSGGGNLSTTGAMVNGPWGLAIDTANGRIYWANNDGNTISSALLTGGGGQDLNTAGATVNGPWGVGIDPSAGRIYWANNLGATMSYANLDGSGGGDITTSAASGHPKYALLVQPPAGLGAPAITGGSTAGSRLSCSPGRWASDLGEAFLYRAPQSIAYAWSRNGIPIRAASSSITASSPGSYACSVTAGNYAGTTSQTSAAFVVSRLSPVTIVVRSRSAASAGLVRVGVLVPYSGRLVGIATFQRRRGQVREYGAAAIAATSPGTATLLIRPTPAARRLLAAGGTLNLGVTLVFVGRDGAIGRTGTSVTVHG